MSCIRGMRYGRTDPVRPADPVRPDPVRPPRTVALPATTAAPLQPDIGRFDAMDFSR